MRCYSASTGIEELSGKIAPHTRRSECRGTHISGEGRWLHIYQLRRARSWGHEGTPQLPHWLSASGSRWLAQLVHTGHWPCFLTDQSDRRPLLVALAALMSSGTERLPSLFLHQSARSAGAPPDPSPMQAWAEPAFRGHPCVSVLGEAGATTPQAPLRESAQCPLSACRNPRVETGRGLLMSTPGSLIHRRSI